jgi:CheY-like chemotaxis protein
VCQNNPDIDLVLMDIHMPEVDGYEATRIIRTFNKDVVIIAQTALGLGEERERALTAGCDDYIAKPILMNEFNELLRKYFQEKV